jgi:hypothetical protein
MRCVLAILLLTACASPAPKPATSATNQGEQPPSAIQSISIEHTPCFGACPIFEYRFERAGTARYTPGRFVQDSAGRTVTISPALFDSLAGEVERAGFFTMDSLYAVTYTDQPSTIITARRGDSLKVVVRYGRPESAPATLQGVIDQLDAAGAKLFGHTAGRP